MPRGDGLLAVMGTMILTTMVGIIVTLITMKTTAAMADAAGMDPEDPGPRHKATNQLGQVGVWLLILYSYSTFLNYPL